MISSQVHNEQSEAEVLIGESTVVKAYISRPTEVRHSDICGEIQTTPLTSY